MAALNLRLNQMRDDHGHQPFAAMRAIHGEAAQRVFKQRARGDHLPVVVVDRGGIGQVSVALDALAREQRVHLRHGALVGRGNGNGEIFIHHGGISSNQLNSLIIP